MTANQQPGLMARGVREDELDDYLHLMCRAFHLDFTNARPIFYSDPFYDVRLKRVLFDEKTGRIVSALTLVPAALRLPSGATAPVAGIAGVCTQPEFQGRGYAHALLQATLADLPALGFPLAALTADAPELYRKLGFEFCSASVSWTVAVGRLLDATVDAPQAQVLSREEWLHEGPSLRSFYDGTISLHPGIFQREARRWTNIESPGARRAVALWKPLGFLEGYAIFHEQLGEAGLILDVLEMVTDSKAGCHALLRVLASRPGVATIQCQMRPSDFQRFHLHGIPGLEHRIGLGMLMHVTDFEQVLAAAKHERWEHLLATSISGLTIRLEGQQSSATQDSIRLFAVMDLSGHVQSVLAPADELLGDWLSLEDHALAQLVTGFRTARQLFTQKQLRASGENALALAEQLFLQSEPFLGPLDAF